MHIHHFSPWIYQYLCIQELDNPLQHFPWVLRRQHHWLEACVGQTLRAKGWIADQWAPSQLKCFGEQERACSLWNCVNMLYLHRKNNKAQCKQIKNIIFQNSSTFFKLSLNSDEIESFKIYAYVKKEHNLWRKEYNENQVILRVSSKIRDKHSSVERYSMFETRLSNPNLFCKEYEINSSCSMCKIMLTKCLPQIDFTIIYGKNIRWI